MSVGPVRLSARSGPMADAPGKVSKGAELPGVSTARDRGRPSVATSLALGVVHFYQHWISPLSGPRCRYYPTCSHYGVEAIERFGAWKGSYLALARLLSCTPWCRGGIDDVPEEFAWTPRSKANRERAAGHRAECQDGHGRRAPHLAEDS